MNNLLITKENKKTKRFILVFLLFTIYFFNGSLILAQNERISVNVKNESVEVVLKKITKQTGAHRRKRRLECDRSSGRGRAENRGFHPQF